MNVCPNPCFGGIECPYALSEDSPLPCFGSFDQCEDWRKKSNYRGAEIGGNERDKV
jgi:hypothetical protein